MKIESANTLYTATSIAEKAAAQTEEQPKTTEVLQEDSVTLSSGPVNTINSGNSGGELPPKKKDTE